MNVTLPRRSRVTSINLERVVEEPGINDEYVFSARLPSSEEPEDTSFQSRRGRSERFRGANPYGSRGRPSPTASRDG